MRVYDKEGNLRCTVPVTSKCVYSKTLMDEEYVLLPFESDTLIGFAKGDYIDTDEWGRFYMVEIAKPTAAGDGGWSYEQKFHAHWEKFRNRICFYDRQGGCEKSWKMTQTPEYFLDIICGNIKAAGYGDYGYDWDDSLTEMKLVSFDGTNIIDALTALAQAWDTEWWISDSIIHLGKCSIGTPVELSELEELSDVDRSDGQNSEYYTRMYAFGSTRNLPTNYRKDDGGTVIEGVVESRLKLPSGVPYVDAWEDMADEDVVEAVAVFDDIYPHMTGTMSAISTKGYTDTETNSDGEEVEVKWLAYRFRDSTMPKPFSENYVLSGEELRIVFQTGKLAGMDFAVTFNPDGYVESADESQLFEIVRNDDYGVSLPSEAFKPEEGDTYILYGYNTSYVYENLVPEAEEELLETAREKIQEASRDKSVFECVTNPVRCAGYKADGNGGLSYSSADEIDLNVGQAVTLLSDNYGTYTSRIQAFEKRLDNKFNATYTIGESTAYSTTKELSEKVDALTASQNALTNAYGSSVHVVGRYDTTAPSDTNVPSFRRARYEFLRKDVSDRSAGTISSDKGFEGGEFKQDVSGVGIYKDSEGVWHIETDVLSVRRKLVAKTLEIQEVKHIGGQTMLTAAGNTIACVVEHVEECFYRCYFPKSDNGKSVTNTWAVGDQAYCQMFNLANNNGTAESRFYWRLVTATSNETTDDTTTIEVDGVEVDASSYHFIDLSCDDPGVSGGYIDGSDVPQAGDKVVQLGYRGDDTDRQNAIIAAGAGGGSPYIYLFYGIKTFELPSDPDRLKPNDNKLTGQLTITAGSSGASNLSDFATAVQEKIRVGARNLLRNSGFTGDYLSEQLSDTKELDADSPLWSDALDHWTTEGTITINEDKSAVSGYSAHIEGGSISQTVDESVSEGDKFVLSFYLQGSVEYEFGGVSGTLRNGVGTFEKPKLQTVYLTAETSENTLKLADKTTTDAEGMTTIADGTIYDLQLERGNVATEWSHNYLDNSSDRAYYQSLKYLSGALRGSTSINGGLILTNVIELGNYTDNEQTDVTAGLSGTRSDNSVSEDVAFWGGGTLEEAIKALAKYGTTDTTQTESGLAQAVIGHNGTAVFNNIHINGSGTFTGAVTITGGQSKTDIDNALQGVSDNKSSIATMSGQIAAIAANFSDLDYLKKALAQSTTIEGGVVATSLLLLGSKDASGNYNALAGLSGIDSVNDGTGVALFFGGNPYANGTSTKADESLAKAVFRFDGSGFLAGGTLSWSKNGFITSKSPFMERWVFLQEYAGGGNSDTAYYIDYSLGANIYVYRTGNVYTLATPELTEKTNSFTTCFVVNISCNNSAGNTSSLQILQADTSDTFSVENYDGTITSGVRYAVFFPEYAPYRLEAHRNGNGVQWRVRNCGYCHTETRTIGGTDYSVIVVGDTKEQSFTIGTKKYSFSNGILVKVADIDDGGTSAP